MPLKARFVLPTPETCPWRSGDDGRGRCGLVAAILPEAPATVSDGACKACCDSYPPSMRHWNPVIASLILRQAEPVLADERLSSERRSKAIEARAKATDLLNVSHGFALAATPLRSVTPCHWLGQEIVSPTSPTTPNAFQCLHPKHQTTTAEGCRRCVDWVDRPPISSPLPLSSLIPPPTTRYGVKPKNWAVAITTSPRRESTLEACLDSVIRAGWTTPRLFLDGTIRLPTQYEHLNVTWRDDSIGAWPAWYLALAEMLMHEPHADAYVMLQDDIILFDRERLTDYLSECLWPGEQTGVVSLFQNRLQTQAEWFHAQGQWPFSAQALIFSPTAARDLMQDPVVAATFLDANAERHVPIPEVIHAWSLRRVIDVWSTNPSLAQHIGNSSTVWRNASLTSNRRAAWFSGAVETAVLVEEPLDVFCEEAFPCPSHRLDAYTQQLASGRRVMAEQRVVICGLCRDVRRHLPRTAARVERLGAMFGDYRVVVIENDSQDESPEFLADWTRSNHRIEAIFEQHNAPKFPQTRSLQRAAWMAQCRNRYREIMCERYAEFDYAIVVDMDLPGGWSYDGVANTFSRDDWDFVGAYGIRRLAVRSSDRNAVRGQPALSHYDVWAFRPAEATPAKRLVDHNQLYLSRGEPLIPVLSCFGGLGVYRMECMRAAAYGGGDCEHVIFHSHLIAAGLDRLFLNPSQIVLYSPA